MRDYPVGYLWIKWGWFLITLLLQALSTEKTGYPHSYQQFHKQEILNQIIDY